MADLGVEAAPLSCYSTFSAAIYDATGGGVQLDSNLPITTEMLGAALEANAGNSVVIAIGWGKAGFAGSSITFAAPTRCADDDGWRWYYTGGAWNDRISSAKTYSGCRKGRWYEHAYWKGAVLICDWACSSMGIMNNQASSLWARNPKG